MNPVSYLFVKTLSGLMLRLGFSLRVRGAEHVPRTGGVLVAANHVSYLDPLVVGVACPRPLTFMARQTLWRHPLMHLFLWQMGVIPIRRLEGDLAAVREAVRRLRAGEAVAIFPEGGRQWTPSPGEAKRGVGLLAIAGRVPVVPAIVQGTYEALPRGSRRLRRAKIQVAFGPQIAYTESRFPAGQRTGHAPADVAARHEALADAVTQRWRQLQDELNHE